MSSHFEEKAKKCWACEYYGGERRRKSGLILGDSTEVSDYGICTCKRSSDYNKQIRENNWCPKFQLWSVLALIISNKEAKRELERQRAEQRRIESESRRISDSSSSSYSSSYNYTSSSSSSYSEPSYTSSSSSSYSKPCNYTSTTKNKTIIGIIIIAVIVIGIITGLSLILIKASSYSSNSSSDNSSSGNYNGGSNSGGSSNSQTPAEVNYYRDGVSYNGNDGYIYKYSSKEDGYYISIAKGYSLSGGIRLPSSFKNKLVIGVSERGFTNQTNLIQIVVPDTVKYIGESAFAGCSSLEGMALPAAPRDDYKGFSLTNLFSSYSNDIPTGLTEICFTAGVVQGCSSCSSLTTVTITEGVTTINANAFKNCSNLTHISIPSSIEYIGDNAFSGCDSLEYYEYDNAKYLGNSTTNCLVLMKAKNTDITSCIINNSTKVIYGAAFNFCSSLSGIDIPNSVKYIGWIAFGHCSALTSISIPNGVNAIETYTFMDCSNLTSVSLPSSIVAIKDSSFSGCSKLKTYYFDGTIAQWGQVSKATGCVNFISSAITVICSDGNAHWDD